MRSGRIDGERSLLDLMDLRVKNLKSGVSLAAEGTVKVFLVIEVGEVREQEGGSELVENGNGFAGSEDVGVFFGGFGNAELREDVCGVVG